ncbi:MAG: hypothetical protein KA797_04585 [Chitinophagales bacterium]|nr:hypothetical protein [Chitinophagales bacterium]
MLNACAHCELCRIDDAVWKGADSIRTTTYLEEYCGESIDEVNKTSFTLKDKTDTSITVIRKTFCH